MNLRSEKKCSVFAHYKEICVQFTDHFSVEKFMEIRYNEFVTGNVNK
jgi:hypothetical protein